MTRISQRIKQSANEEVKYVNKNPFLYIKLFIKWTTSVIKKYATKNKIKWVRTSECFTIGLIILVSYNDLNCNQLHIIIIWTYYNKTSNYKKKKQEKSYVWFECNFQPVEKQFARSFHSNLVLFKIFCLEFKL